MDKLHVVHSENGKIGGRAKTTPADLDAIVDKLAQHPSKHLVLHFHGGLVTSDTAFELPEGPLRTAYAHPEGEGGYPVYFAWESGSWETIRNNLGELGSHPIYQLLLKHVERRAEIPSPTATPSTYKSAAFTSPAMSDADKIQAVLAFPEIDAYDIEADLAADPEAQIALGTLVNWGDPMKKLPRSTSGSSEITEIFRSEFVGQGGNKSTDSISRLEVAKYVLRVLGGVWSRYATGRDHGLHATCVEELVRAVQISGQGVNGWAKKLQWNTMKKDTADAFGNDPDVHAGTALMQRLKTAIDARKLTLDRITLVGHSAGSYYVANWLKHCTLDRNIRHDVVLLAPAITFDAFSETLKSSGDRINGFRMFAMKDQHERVDQVWNGGVDANGARNWRRFVYPASLLYLVSGLLESRNENGILTDEADKPLLGLHRFHSNPQVYDADRFPTIASVKNWLAHRPGSVVWSKAIGQPVGLNCESIDHGYFDNDLLTMQSLRHVIEKGF